MTPFLVWACTAGTPVHLERRSAALTLEGEGISRVEIRSPAGVPVLVRTFPRALDRLDLPVAWSQGGTWTVRPPSAAGSSTDAIRLAVASATPAIATMFAGPSTAGPSIL